MIKQDLINVITTYRLADKRPAACLVTSCWVMIDVSDGCAEVCSAIDTSSIIWLHQPGYIC